MINIFVVTFIGTFVLLTVIVLLIVWTATKYSLGPDSPLPSSDLPREYLNDEESLLQLSHEYDYNHLSPPEQEYYLKGQQFTATHTPNYATRGQSITPWIQSDIRDRGIAAFEFEQDTINIIPKYVVEDKTEINFTDNDMPYSTATSVLNYCLPVRNRSVSDCIYFETKIFEYSPTPNSHFAIGLVTKPYPSFRLPGYNNFSISYESTGNLKINKPFPSPTQQHQGEQSLFNALVLPPLLQSDVVGFGYHIITGTVFITRNGKKVMDVMRGLFVDMYPAVGCFSTNGKFQVNIGQLGFVWIEANVKKYGFISTSDYKKLRGERGLVSLPEYGGANAKEDKLLDKGDELPPRYPVDELDFFGRKVDEKAAKNFGSTITNVSEEVMDLQQRAYEENVSKDYGPNKEDMVEGSSRDLDVLSGVDNAADRSIMRDHQNRLLHTPGSESSTRLAEIPTRQSYGATDELEEQISGSSQE